jgi:hypothetical protein
MYSARQLCSAILIFATGLYSPTADAIVAAFVSDTSASPGTEASIQIEVATHEILTDFTLELVYDNSLVSVSSVTAGTLLDGWGDAGLVWTDDADAGTLTLIGAAHDMPPVSWTTGNMVDIVFNVDGDAPFDAVSPLSLDIAAFFGPDGTEHMSFQENGSITITDPDAPPPPEPLSLHLQVPDITVVPGEDVLIDVILVADAPTIAVAFTLWVDDSVFSVDTTRDVVVTELASPAAASSIAISPAQHAYAMGTTVDGPYMEPVDGVVLQLPYTVSSSAEPGLRSLMLAATDGFVMLDGMVTNVEVESTSGIVTIVALESDDTGMAEDTGMAKDTGDDPVDDDPVDDADGPDPISGTESTTTEKNAGCGCAMVGSESSFWWALIPGIAIAVRRRSSRT